MLPLFLLLGAATLPCPSLDSATVAGVYGTKDLVVRASERGYTCLFSRDDYSLQVQVLELPPAQFAVFAGEQCTGSSGMKTLKGIGNQAVVCASKVISRVRNRAFVLSLTTIDKAADEKSIRAKNILLAEQVAGNLF